MTNAYTKDDVSIHYSSEQISDWLCIHLAVVCCNVTLLLSSWWNVVFIGGSGFDPRPGHRVQYLSPHMVRVQVYTTIGGRGEGKCVAHTGWSVLCCARTGPSSRAPWRRRYSGREQLAAPGCGMHTGQHINDSSNSCGECVCVWMLTYVHTYVYSNLHVNTKWDSVG